MFSTNTCYSFSFHMSFANTFRLCILTAQLRYLSVIILSFTIFSSQNFLQKWWDLHGVLFVSLIFFSLKRNGYNSLFSISNIIILVKFSLLFTVFQRFRSQKNVRYRWRMLSPVLALCINPPQSWPVLPFGSIMITVKSSGYSFSFQHSAFLWLSASINKDKKILFEA